MMEERQESIDREIERDRVTVTLKRMGQNRVRGKVGKKEVHIKKKKKFNIGGQQ